MIHNNQFIGLRNANNILKSFQQDSVQLPDLDTLRKAEGSRGGKVIGHTKSGKAVYAHKVAHHVDHKGWTSHDHSDASKLHEENAINIHTAGTKKNLSEFGRQRLNEDYMSAAKKSKDHENIAIKKQESYLKAKNKNTSED